MPYKDPILKRNQQRINYQHYKKTSPFKHKARRARCRARDLQVPFDLDADYLESIWTGICPVLQEPISLIEEQGHEHAAELDRFIGNKGYVKGNVHFLSRRANRIKNNATTKELQQLIDWMKQYED